MECQCGGYIDTVAQVRNKIHARLTYLQCSSCGRVSNGELFIRNLCVAVDLPDDPIARRQFSTITEREAENIYQGTKTLQEALLAQPTGLGTKEEQLHLF